MCREDARCLAYIYRSAFDSPGSNGCWHIDYLGNDLESSKAHVDSVFRWDFFFRILCFIYYPDEVVMVYLGSGRISSLLVMTFLLVLSIRSTHDCAKRKKHLLTCEIPRINRSVFLYVMLRLIWDSWMFPPVMFYKKAAFTIVFELPASRGVSSVVTAPCRTRNK